MSPEFGGGYIGDRAAGDLTGAAGLQVKKRTHVSNIGFAYFV